MIIMMFRIFLEETRMSRQDTEHSCPSECALKGKDSSNIYDFLSCHSDFLRVFLFYLAISTCSL